MQKCTVAARRMAIMAMDKALFGALWSLMHVIKALFPEHIILTVSVFPSENINR